MSSLLQNNQSGLTAKHQGRKSKKFPLWRVKVFKMKCSKKEKLNKMLNVLDLNLHFAFTPEYFLITNSPNYSLY